MPILNNCCYCFDLRTGVFIIGVATAIFSGLSLIHIQDEKTIEASITILSGLVFLISSVLLIIGVHQESSKLMLPWLIIHMFFAVINVVAIIVHPMFEENTGVIGLFTLVFMIVFIYIWLVVYSMYKIIKELEYDF